jgi:SAM-dependent methyltransferase
VLRGGGREWLGARAHGQILEVAIGTGLNLAHYPAAATVTGIELSPAMLALARQRASSLGRDVDLRAGDAEHLPFDDATFDTAVCALSLCTIAGPAAAVAEMKRVLVPGGRLLPFEHVGSTWPPVYAAQWLLERLTIRSAGEHFTRRPLPLVEAAGFEIVEVDGSRPARSNASSRASRSPDDPDGGRWCGDAVVKLYRPGYVGYCAEAAALTALEGCGGAPRLLEVVNRAGRPGLVLQRLDGTDMLTLLQAQPWRMLGLARVLADAHRAVHRVHAPLQACDRCC